MNIPQYVTQLTREWIRSVSKRTVQGSFIRIDETDDNRTISVDVDQLKRYGSLGFVDTSTDQTVGGQKTFTDVPSFLYGLRVILGSNNWVQGWRSVNFKSLDGASIGQLVAGNESSTKHGMHMRSYNGANTWAGISVFLTSDNKGSQTLDRVPADDNQLTSDQQIAWRGWVNDKFIRKTAIGQSGGVAAYVHTHAYAASNHDHDKTYAAKTHDHDNTYAAKSSYDTLNSTVNGHTSSIAAIEQTLENFDINALKNEIDTYSNVKKNEVETALDTKAQGIYDNLDGYVTAQELEDLEDDIEDLFVQKTSLYEGDTKLFVDTSTAQTVGGIKNFTSAPKFSGGGPLVILGTNNWVQGWESIKFNSLDGANIGKLIAGNESSTKHGMHMRSYNGANTWAGISVFLTSDNKGSQTLDRVPADDNQLTSDQQIAWRGWVNDKFIRKTAIGQSGGVAAYVHTHAYAAANHTHDYAAETHNHDNTYAAKSSYDTLNSTVNGHTSSIAAIEQTLENFDIEAKKEEINTYSNVKKKEVEDTIDAKAQGIYDNLDGYVTVDGFNDLLDEIIDDYGILTSTAPSADEATAAVGSSTESARADHKHPIETPAAATAYTPLGDTSGEGGLSTNDTTYTTPGGASGRGCIVRVHTRTYYDHTASSPVLYGYFRMLRFNQFGRLVGVSAETRYEIDTPTVVEAS